MNLARLFDIQKVLDAAIVEKKGLEGRDTLPEKILALQVELGECANEWRGFKFWSEDREPRTEAWHMKEIHSKFPILPIKNRLLEEYVDCLHFILSIGLKLKIDFEQLTYELEGNIKTHKYDNITVQFIWLGNTVSNLFPYKERDYTLLVCEFIALGEMLGFTWDQIESAYFEN